MIKKHPETTAKQCTLSARGTVGQRHQTLATSWRVQRGERRVQQPTHIVLLWPPINRWNLWFPVGYLPNARYRAPLEFRRSIRQYWAYHLQSKPTTPLIGQLSGVLVWQKVCLTSIRLPIRRLEMDRKGVYREPPVGCIDFSFDVNVGDLIGKNGLNNLWFGYSLHLHRSRSLKTPLSLVVSRRQ